MKKFIPILTLTALLSPLAPAQDRPKVRENRKPMTDKVDWTSIKKRIEGAVERGDITREEADQKYLAMKKKDDQTDWTSIKKRIEGAVENGDITREEADQKYLAMKKKLTPPARRTDARLTDRRPQTVRPMANQERPDALKRVLADLVSQKKITKEDARRIAQAANSTPPVQSRYRDQRSGANDELRETLNAAKRELAMLREARENMMRQHNEHQEQRELMEREQAARRQEMNRERERTEREKELAMARKEIQEQRQKSAEMREQAERRMREIAEQAKKLEERRKAMQDKVKKEE